MDIEKLAIDVYRKVETFNEGMQAANNGLKCQDNPYKGRSAFGRIQSEQDYNNWLDGYLHGKGIIL